MNEPASAREHEQFLAEHGELVRRLAEAGWTRREAGYRLLALYPRADRQALDRALREHDWKAPEAAEEPLAGTVVASSVWLAVNDLFDLGVDRDAAAADLDPLILQDMAQFLDVSGASGEAAAAILGRIGATMEFLTAYPHTTLSRAEYREFRSHLPESLQGLSLRRAGSWPVSEQTFAECFGEGDWSRALLAVGLAPEERYSSSGRDRNPDFTETRFRSALADFLTYCIRNDRRPQALLYGRWAADVEHQPVPRPSLASVRHVYGSWHRALAAGRELINAGVPHESDPRFAEHWVGPWSAGAGDAGAPVPERWQDAAWADRGIGVVEKNTGEALGDENAWEDLVAEIAEALQDLPWNHFLNVEYDTGNTGGNLPYVQAFTGPAGVDLHLVSETFLPAIVWPLDDEHLLETGWEAPTEARPHFARHRLGVEEAASLAVDGLRYGRDCTDPYRFRWGSGSIYRQGEDGAASRARRS